MTEPQNGGATVETNEVINHTIGRATNDQLEATEAVWLKDEDEVGGETCGPVYLQISGDLVAYNNGSAEWFPASFAEALAKELGVPVRFS